MINEELIPLVYVIGFCVELVGADFHILCSAALGSD
jgi:hypothetical protein